MIKSQISNLKTYKQYMSVIAKIEQFLNNHKFLKLDLPVLLPALIPESYLEVYESEYRYFEKLQKRYLTPSPEILIKRLLGEGIGDCYYLGKAFRNCEPTSSKHDGEFTILEFYKVGATYLDIADLVLCLLQELSLIANTDKQLPISHTISYQGVAIDLSRWEKLTVAEAFKKYSDIAPDELFDHDKFISIAKKKGYQVLLSDKTDKTFSYEQLWSQIYTNEVEKHLGTNGFPTILYDYPIEFAALSKPNPDGKTAQRFEFYIAGVELGNCYSELTDWKLQEDRLIKEEQERIISGKIPYNCDNEFVEVLKKGLPDCAGIAIGVERLAMIIANVDSINSLKLIKIE